MLKFSKSEQFYPTDQLFLTTIVLIHHMKYITHTYPHSIIVALDLGRPESDPI